MMPTSDANPNRQANASPSVHSTSDGLRLTVRGEADQSEPAAAGPPPGQPLRRQELERLLQYRLADLSACVELAEIYRQEDRPADAVRVLRKALPYHAEDPSFLWAYEEALLARSLQQLREVTDLAARLKTIEVEQEKERCETDWATCRIDVCRARLQRAPDNQHLRLTLAQALKELERFDEAIQEAEKAGQDDRYASTAHLIRAQCLDATGKRFEALPAYRAAAARSHPAPARIRVLALDAAAEIAEATGLEASAQRYRRFLRAAETERRGDQENHSVESQSTSPPVTREWELAQENIMSEYESATLKTREELNRLLASVRLTRRQERRSVVRVTDDRCKAIRDLYDERKRHSLEQQRKADVRLDKAMAIADRAIEEVRRIVVRRLGQLPVVLPLAETDRCSDPNSVHEAENAIRSASRQIRDTRRELIIRAPAALAQSFWTLAAVCGLFLLLWAAAAIAVGGFSGWVVMAIGIFLIFFLFLSVSSILQIPLRRRTREVYPHAERLYAAARRALEAGTAVAATTATKEAAKLVRQRNVELRSAELWEQEQFEAIDRAIHEKEDAERRSLERELETIRERFKQAIDKLDRVI